jgi:uncharacterized membrane protein YqjE
LIVPPGAAPQPLMAGLRRLCGSALALAQVRLQLLGTELEQEKQRVVAAFVRAALGLLMIGLALVLAIAFVVLLFWEGHRLPAIGVLTVLLGGGGVLLLQRARSALHAGPGGPFALSLGELQRDRHDASAAAPPH